MVPTSTSFAPARFMMSGIRNAPPISISSPRETGTSLRFASVSRTSSTAAALLLTTSAASAEVSRHSRGSMCRCRSPRRPVAMSNSRLLAPRATSDIDAMASSGSGARPRFVCSTVPVRLNRGMSDGAVIVPTRVATDASRSALVRPPPDMTAARASSSVPRTASSTSGRPWLRISAAIASSASSRSTEGSSVGDEMRAKSKAPGVRCRTGSGIVLNTPPCLNR